MSEFDRVKVEVNQVCEHWSLQSPEIAKEVITKVCEEVLEGRALFPVVVSVNLIDDAGICKLNQHWRGFEKATDVLSFPQYSPEELTQLEGGLSDVILGDVVISYETTQRQAKEQSKAMESRLVELLVHGALHLLGYDHEDDDQMAEEMYMMEDRILDQFSDRFGVGLQKGE